MAKPRALNVEFQGFPCSPIFEVELSAGLSPSLAIVNIARQDLGKIVIQDRSEGFWKSLEYAADLSASTGPGKLYTVGDLLVQDLEDSVEGPTIRFRHLLLAERSIESVAATDGDQDGLIQIELRDIRALWDQGVVFAWVNVPRQSTFSDPLNPLGTVDQQRFVPGSTDGGSAWTLRRVLEVHVLPRLPGKPPLRKLSDVLENREVGSHKWDGVPAKQAFQELLTEFDAVCVLNPEASVSVWRRGDGPLQDHDGKPIPPDDDSVASRRIMLSHRSTVPDTVLVIGRPIVETVTEVLVPVGEVSFPNGTTQLMPLRNALAMMNVPASVTPKVLLLSGASELAVGQVPNEAADAISKWGFKWYCLGSYVLGQKTQVPIENCAETDVDGQRLPPVVRSQAVRVVNVAQALAVAKEGGRSTLTPRASAPVATTIDKAVDFAAGNLKRFASYLWGDDYVAPKIIDAEAAIVKNFLDGAVDAYEFAASHGGPGQAPGGAPGAGPTLVPAATLDLPHLTSTNKVVMNVPLGVFPNEGAYEIDHRRGLVKFHKPRFQVQEDGIPIDEASVRAAAATLTFGVSRKPAPDQGLRLDDRYFSMWTYFGSRGPESEDLGEVGDQLGKPLVVKVKDEDVAKVDLSTVTVIESDLQLLLTLDKRNNRVALDGIAQALAEPVILANRFVPGAVVELVGIADVVPTGRVLSVVWKSTNGLPSTTAHDGHPAPLRAAPRPVTIGDIRRGFGRVGVESVGTSALTYLPGARQ